MDRVVEKAFGTLAFIAESFEHRSSEAMLRLYRTLVRPLLEYYVQFWSPSCRKDIIKLERVQKRFPKMLPGVESFSDKERLDRLRLFTLEHRRLRFGMGDFKTMGHIFK
eukprot:g35978.t1